MSVEHACNAIAAWAGTYGVSNDRDLSPFLTGALLVALADEPATDAELALITQMQQSLTGQDLTEQTLVAEAQWIEENGVDAAIKAIADNVPEEGPRELLVLMSALVATVERSVNEKEGVMLQKIGRGLGHSEHGVQKLLAQAMQAASGSY